MQEFIDLAQYMAVISADIIRPYFRANIAVDAKKDGTPVTIADKKAEEAMRELIMKELPAHGIIGEEFGTHQPDSQYQWVLDPIDGTKTFISGTPLFGTLIGLLKDGEPILGVINNPIINHLLLGTNDETRLNGDIVRVRPCDKIENSTLLATSHWSTKQFHDMTAFEKLTRRAKLYRSWGDCHGYYLVATGFADIMLDPIVNLWDLAALVPVIRGAGGKITDWHGNDDVINGYGVIATAGGELHDCVVQALNPTA